MKNHKISNNSTTTKPSKNKHRFKILRNFNNFLTFVWLNLQIIEFYLTKYVVTIIITMTKVSKKMSRGQMPH